MPPSQYMVYDIQYTTKFGICQAEAMLKRVGHLTISDSSVWRRVQEWGEKFEEVEDARRERANALPGRSDMYRGVSETVQRMGVSMDGGMVHIRDEGWKELKVGCVLVAPKLKCTYANRNLTNIKFYGILYMVYQILAR